MPTGLDPVSDSISRAYDLWEAAMTEMDREMLAMQEGELSARVVSFCEKWGKDKLTKRSPDDSPEMLLELRTLKRIWKSLKEKANRLKISIPPDINKIFKMDWE